MKRVILLTYTFPPLSSGGTPVVLNLCNYLPDNGWEVIPVTVKNPSGMSTDETTLADLPENLEVHRVPHGTLSTKVTPTVKGPVKRILGGLIHNYVLVPDRVITWKKAVLPVLEKLISEKQAHCIISFGPHHSLHLIACEAAGKGDIPFIPFFGDLWLADSYVQWPSRINRMIEGLLEKRVVQRARGIIATTEGSTGYFLNRYSSICPPVHVAENAYDPERTGKPAPPAERGDFLRAGWTGNFFSTQSPEALIAGLQMFHKRNPESKLRLRMAGDMDDISRRILHSEPLAGRVEHMGRLPWNEVPGFQKDCDLLVAFINGRRYSSLKNSSKTSEYLISGRSILAVVPEGDMAERVRDYGRGYVCEPVPDEIAVTLEKLEYQWRTEGLNLPVDYEAIRERFSAPSVMKRLGAFLDRMAAP